MQLISKCSDEYISSFVDGVSQLEAESTNACKEFVTKNNATVLVNVSTFINLVNDPVEGIINFVVKAVISSNAWVGD